MSIFALWKFHKGMLLYVEHGLVESLNKGEFVIKRKNKTLLSTNYERMPEKCQ